MTRGQLTDTYNTAKKNSALDQTNAQVDRSNTNNSLGRFTQNLSDYMAGARSRYGVGGEFAKDQAVIANTTAAAGSNGLGTDLTLHGMRSGENTAGYAGTLAEARRKASRDLTSQLAGADAQRLGQLNEAERYGVDASRFPAGVQEAMYGTSLGAANGSLNTAEQAAQANQSFGDQLGGAFAQQLGKTLAGGNVSFTKGL